jgi:predicted RNA-binding Zn ribbon-like protein
LNAEENKESEFRDGMPFLGGATWIDLLNSTLSPDGVTRLDFLGDDAAFARWLARAGFATPEELASERQAVADLRDTLRPAFEALAAGKPLPKALIARLNALLAGAPFVRQIEYDPAEARYHVHKAPADAPHGVAAQIAGEFVAFLISYEAERLKHCANPACTMVFYDQGRNNRRRWCSSAVCGNRDKVANYRARKASRT